MFYCLSSDLNKKNGRNALLESSHTWGSLVFLLGVAIQNVLNLNFKHRKRLLKKSICVVSKTISIIPRSIRMSNVGKFS